MISHIVNLNVANAKAEQFYDFMINPNDEQYSKWWPKEHFQCHITKRGDENHLGDEVFFDENIGETRRLAFHATVTKAERPYAIAWSMKKAGILLSAYLELGLDDLSEGLAIRHELKIGYGGIPGKMLDPFIRIYFNKSFQNALEKHCLTEWPKLALFLSSAE